MFRKEGLNYKKDKSIIQDNGVYLPTQSMVQYYQMNYELQSV